MIWRDWTKLIRFQNLRTEVRLIKKFFFFLICNGRLVISAPFGNQLSGTIVYELFQNDWNISLQICAEEVSSDSIEWIGYNWRWLIIDEYVASEFTGRKRQIVRKQVFNNEWSLQTFKRFLYNLYIGDSGRTKTRKKTRKTLQNFGEVKDRISKRVRTTKISNKTLKGLFLFCKNNLKMNIGCIPELLILFILLVLPET